MATPPTGQLPTTIPHYRYRVEFGLKLKPGLRIKLKLRESMDPSDVFEKLSPPGLWSYGGRPEEFFLAMPWFLGVSDTSRAPLLDSVQYMAYTSHAASSVYILEMPDKTFALRVETHRLVVLQQELDLMADFLTSKGAGYQLALVAGVGGGPVGQVWEYSLVASHRTEIPTGTEELPRKALIFAIHGRPTFWSLYTDALYRAGAITLLVRVAPDFYTKYQEGTPGKAVATTVVALLAAAGIAFVWSLINYRRMRASPCLTWRRSKE